MTAITAPPGVSFVRPPPPPVPDVAVSIPAPHVLLVRLDRPRQLNALRSAHHAGLARLWAWFDAEPWLRCGVVTGTGRAFCAGADLKQWHGQGDTRPGARGSDPPVGELAQAHSDGFGGISNRAGKKPIVAAVNGLCLGGGMEMAINCDMVVAAEDARFGLPEVTRGVVALAGALPRLVRSVGRQRAAELALTGRPVAAAVLERWGLVNRVTAPGDAVLAEALALAAAVAANSPDAVVVSREALRLGWEPLGPQLATEILDAGLYGRINGGPNMKEGLASFVEKRSPVWVDSKL